jgi:hypothetical protein
MASANTRFLRGDDDANDHIGSDTPRSGVATPQPDPSDKRLPGINHGYFGQVGSCSSSSPSFSGPKTPISVQGNEPEVLSPFGHREEMVEDYVLLSVTPDAQMEKTGERCSHEQQRNSPPLLPNERTELALGSEPLPSEDLHPYPTPPISQSPSLHTLKLSDASSEVEGISPKKAVLSFSSHRKSISLSEAVSSSARRASLMNPLSSVVTASNVHAAHFSKPSISCPTTTPSTPIHSRLNSDFHESSSYELLKRLTDDASRIKSIPATPTRALSSTTARSDGSDHAAEKNGKANGAETRPPLLSTPSAITSAPTAKGKLTVQIKEARGLRKSKDPYVVAVFQRNELVSKGPRLEYGDQMEAPAPLMGGMPISRTTSDSGRPMAIPMKSRQSSNTSLSEYRDFKSKARRSMTNPKWDTEAVL